jgi:hypothetical protein
MREDEVAAAEQPDRYARQRTMMEEINRKRREDKGAPESPPAPLV